MRNILILSVCILLSSATFGQGVNKGSLDEAMPYKHVLKTNPLTLAFGDLNVTWERVINHKSAFTITGNIVFPTFDDGEYAGVFLTVGYKHYFTHARLAVPAGFYVRPLAGIFVADDSFGVRVGGQVGYQWVWKSGFVLDLGLGPQLIMSDGYVDGPLPSLFIGIGYAF